MDEARGNPVDGGDRVFDTSSKFDGPGPSEHNATRTALQPQPIPHGFDPPRFPILVVQWPRPAGVSKAYP